MATNELDDRFQCCVIQVLGVSQSEEAWVDFWICLLRPTARNRSPKCTSARDDQLIALAPFQVENHLAENDQEMLECNRSNGKKTCTWPRAYQTA